MHVVTPLPRRTAVSPRRGRTLVVWAAALVAALVVGSGLAVPQTAQAADTDIVNVPDPQWLAVLNKAIASTNPRTTRDPGAPITVADALRVTTITATSAADRKPISDFTGIEAFTNVTAVNVGGTRASVGTQGTVSDLTPWAALTKVTSFQLLSFPRVTDLSPLASLVNIKTLNLTEDGVSDLGPATQLPALTSLNATATKVTDLSSLAPLKNASQFTTLNVSNTGLTDMTPLAGFKYLTNINLGDNRIEDASVISTFDSSYAICGPTGSIFLSDNRLRDLSVTCQGAATAPKLNFPSGQTIYVGPYTPGGVTVFLKYLAGYTAKVQDPAVGSYDPVTGLLTSVDPSAPSVPIRAASPSSYAAAWTVYFSEDPDKLADLRINEVESDADARGDWVELYNPSPTPVDLGGVVVSDNDNTHQLTFPAGTTIPGKGYRALVTDDSSLTGSFELDGADSARIFAPGTTDLAAATPIDSYTWTEHAATTYGRTVPGGGSWAITGGGTFEAENASAVPTEVSTVTVTGDAAPFDGKPALTATVTKPSGDLATDAIGTVTFFVDGDNASGPVPVVGGLAEWTPTTVLPGSPDGTVHAVTARYRAVVGTDHYTDSAESAPFTVTVVIRDFVGQPTLSTTNPRYCDTIASDISGLDPAPESVSYQWQRFSPRFLVWTDLAGVRSPSVPVYQLRGDGVPFVSDDAALRVQVTVTAAGYFPTTFTLEAAASVRETLDPEPGWTPVLSTSTPQVGDTITATHDEWTNCFPADLHYRLGYSYRWLRDGKPIPGATDQVFESANGAGGPKEVSYQVTPEDAGHEISLSVDGGGSNSIGSPLVSEPTAAVAPTEFAASPAPTIDDQAPGLGSTLSVSTAAWSPAAEFSYEWLRDGQSIAGARGTTYLTGTSDVGHVISVRVTGTSLGYVTASRISPPTASVIPGRFTQTPAPLVDNTSPKVGDRLTATTAAWSPDAQRAYQWLRDGQPVPGATSARYTARVEDLGHALSVRVTGAALGYATESKTSEPTAAVAAGVFADSTNPVIDDTTPEVDDTLTAIVAEWAPVAEFGYQWLRDDEPIAGATGTTYRTVTADVGHAISVQVTGAAPGHVSTVRTSAATAKIPPVVVEPPTVSRSATVAVAALKGRKIEVRVSVPDLEVSALTRTVTVRVARVPGTFSVQLENGVGTLALKGSKAHKVKTGKKARVTVTVHPFSWTVGSTTYLVEKTVKTVKVTLRS